MVGQAKCGNAVYGSAGAAANGRGFVTRCSPSSRRSRDVRRCQDVLEALLRDCLEGRPLRFTYSLFLVEVVKG
jgi:hypothetical protein